MRISLEEEIIGSVADTIKVRMQISKTNHAGDRQSRDLDDFITDEDITNGLDDALKVIGRALMMDDIKMEDYICVMNRRFKPTLNIVGRITNKRNQLQFVVITIMKKNNFKPKANTHKLEIK